MPLSTPDITKAQILSLVTAALGLAVSFGLDLSTGQQAAVIAFCTAALVFLPVADAIIRHGRSKVAAASVTAEALAVRGEPTGVVAPPAV
jgi:hypothetical protein